jgi:hypothetical protein
MTNVAELHPVADQHVADQHSVDRGAADGRAAQPRLRITRRGRIVLGSLIVVPVLAVLAFQALAGTPAVATGSAPERDLAHVTIMPGESLWSLAEQIAPGSDPLTVIDEIVALNRLDSTSVEQGQRLSLPAKYDR